MMQRRSKYEYNLNVILASQENCSLIKWIIGCHGVTQCIENNFHPLFFPQGNCWAKRGIRIFYICDPPLQREQWWLWLVLIWQWPPHRCSSRWSYHSARCCSGLGRPWPPAPAPPPTGISAARPSGRETDWLDKVGLCFFGIRTMKKEAIWMIFTPLSPTLYQCYPSLLPSDLCDVLCVGDGGNEGLHSLKIWAALATLMEVMMMMVVGASAVETSQWVNQALVQDGTQRLQTWKTTW